MRSNTKNTKNSSFYKNKLSTLLIILGTVGYTLAFIAFCFAIYFAIVSWQHPNAAEDQQYGLSGLQFILTVISGVVITILSSALFVPGYIIKRRSK